MVQPTTINERDIDVPRARRFGAKAAREGLGLFANPFETRARANAWVEGYLSELGEREQQKKGR